MRRLRLPIASFSLLALLGCAQTSTPEDDTSRPDETAIAHAEAAAASNDLTFETTESIEASSYGLNGDGVTDNTSLFQALLGNGNRTIHVTPGDYVTGSLNIPANTILKLDPGVIIRDSGQLTDAQRLINIRSENVRIEGPGATVIANRADYTSGEQRHGVFIFGAKNVVIDGLQSMSHGGDGFYIGGPPGSPSTDITLRACTADNNRRQGLSITSARRVLVVDGEFKNTNGTAPEFGIDLEPNAPVDYMDEITILRPHTAGNNGGGIMVYLEKLDTTSYPARISIIQHSSTDEPRNLRSSVPEQVDAIVLYGTQP